MSNPKAVLISDVHYSLNTLAVADKAFRMAIDEASRLRVPLIDCGDLTNDKAILRAEVVESLIWTMQYARACGVEVTCIVGNHSLVNERGTQHALEFLRPYCQVVEHHEVWHGLHLIPYQSSTENLSAILHHLPFGSTVICHQGIHGSNMGTYVQDKTAVPKEWFSRFRTLSGHYHQRQDIWCGDIYKEWDQDKAGNFSYVGNPYTLSYSESNDGPKGFCVLYDDGSLEQVPTNLRRHVILEVPAAHLGRALQVVPGDQVWAKVRGTRVQLDPLDKREFGERVLGTVEYKLEKIYTDQPQLEVKAESMTAAEIYDSLINSSGESPEQVARLKALWKEVLSG